MATAKKNIFIVEELEWLEAKALGLKEYVDANPFIDLVDRMAYKETRNGGMIPTVVASIESQIKSITQAMKDYAQLLEVINKMREVEEAKVEARGKGELSSQAEEWLKNRTK